MTNKRPDLLKRTAAPGDARAEQALLDSGPYRNLLARTHPLLALNDSRLPPLPSFIAPLDTREPLVPGFFKRVVDLGHAALPRTVAPRALFLGTPFERYDQSHLFDAVSDPHALAAASTKAAQRENAAVVVITNVNVSYPRRRALLRAGFVALPSFPDTIIDVPESFDALLARLPQGDRSGIRRNRRRFERAGHTLVRLRNARPHKDALYACYRPFFERARVKWQAHTPAYFECLTDLGDAVHLTAAQNADGEIVGFIVNFDDGHSMQSGRIGVLPTYDRKDAVYFCLLYAAVEEAIAARCQTLSLEPTGYRMKRHLGAQRVPMENYLLGVSPVWRALLKSCAGLGRAALAHLLSASALEETY